MTQCVTVPSFHGINTPVVAHLKWPELGQKTKENLKKAQSFPQNIESSAQLLPSSLSQCGGNSVKQDDLSPEVGAESNLPKKIGVFSPHSQISRSSKISTNH